MIVGSRNVNSIRLPGVEALLACHNPGVLCPQELKVGYDEFPVEGITACGYTSAVFAQARRNGVATVSREPCEPLTCGFAGDPAEGRARVISASLSGLHLVNMYVVNGQAVGSSDYELKVAWLDPFTVWRRDSFDSRWPLLVVGDLNVAPTDLDVHDADRCRGLNLCSASERARIDALFGWGLVDPLRLHDPGPGPFIFWDHCEGAFHRGWGLRPDLAFGTQPVAERSTGVRVDRDERKPTFGPGKPSDHAPLIVTLT